MHSVMYKLAQPCTPAHLHDICSEQQGRRQTQPKPGHSPGPHMLAAQWQQRLRDQCQAARAGGVRGATGRLLKQGQLASLFFVANAQHNKGGFS